MTRTGDGRTWLEHLGVDECWRLLAGTQVGRLGVIYDSAPEIYPINHVIDERTIVFRTDPGNKLHGLVRTPAVCYEVDAIDPAAETGWSVLVKGHAAEVTDPGEQQRLDELPLTFWSLGPKEHWIRITADEVTGRRLWPLSSGDRPGRQDG